jgi:hypothetical protein
VRPHKSAGGIPDDFMLVSDAKLPDPFLFPDGTQVQSSDDWKCRSTAAADLTFNRYFKCLGNIIHIRLRSVHNVSKSTGQEDE